MSQATDGKPQPKRSVKHVLEAVFRLADWYRQYKPDVKTIYVTAADYAALERATGTRGLTLTPEGIMYQGFVLKVAP